MATYTAKGHTMGYSNYPDGMSEGDIPGYWEVECPTCEAEGYEDDCPTCEGTGTVDSRVDDYDPSW